MDYKDTLNLPKTDFPMKANLPNREPETEKFWSSMEIDSGIKFARSENPKYTLHDGPPYANGHIHIGHALNKTLKDVVVKYKTMRGFSCDYIPGWDCHGLPVELQLLKKLKIRKGEIPQVEFRQKAHDYAMSFVDIQREEFKRLGIFGNWQNPYLTFDKNYEFAIINSFAELVKEGYIYKGLKPVNYCYECETALAEAEVEYENYTSPSVYVKFKLQDRLPFAVDHLPLEEDIYILIWTTTPWTLIANVAIALHPHAEYVLVKSANGNIILAKELLPQAAEKAALKDCKVLGTVKGSSLEGLTYEHPFGLRKGKVVLADYVSMEEGTGCVHTAPGHGQDDYQTGLKYKLPIVMPVDEKGRFTDEAGEFKGMNVRKANPLIADKLKESGLLLYQASITHSYPHCWRCKSPIIFRATEQWFMSIDHMGLRNRLLGEIKKIDWIPPQGRERISAMIESRPDWCLSRQRSWGVPIPVFLCKKCDKWIADYALIKYFAEIVKEKGSDAWFQLDAKELMPAGYKCVGCGSLDFAKGEDIVDVWFESGISHQAVLKDKDTVSYPADLYLEGSDQHRGWFQSSLITSVALDNKSAYKSVLTHGFVVDGEGRKMSKSLGNVVSPQDIIKKFGADILRLWVASCDYNDDIRISDNILARITEAYRKIRNTARFMLGNLHGFDPDADAVPYDKMAEVDRWAISKAHSLLKDISFCYEGFQFHKAYHSLYNFCIVDMSNFYLDILKDKLYTFKSDSFQRRSCQSAMHEILKVLTTVITPVLVFTAEEIWQNMPKYKGMPKSVHLSQWPDLNGLKINSPLQERWQKLKNIRDLVLKVLEDKRGCGIIGSSLEAKVTLYAGSNDIYSFIKGYETLLPELFIVSQACLKSEPAPAEAFKDQALADIAVLVEKADGGKCSRCWNYSLSTGKDPDYPQACDRCQAVLKAIKK